MKTVLVDASYYSAPRVWFMGAVYGRCGGIKCVTHVNVDFVGGLNYDAPSLQRLLDEAIRRRHFG